METALLMQELGSKAKEASKSVKIASTGSKNQSLLYLAKLLAAKQGELIAENERDLMAARQRGLSDALIDRLALNEQRIAGMIEGLQQVAALNDPVGEISDLNYRPSGIQVGKMRVPLGVVGIIYESRPNVTIEAASLCLKSGNTVILRGGSESIYSNLFLAKLIKEALEHAELPADAVQLVPTTDRAAVSALISMPQFVDVIIPRGGKSLIERLSREAKVPVIKHLDGICHTYIDRDADVDKAVAVSVNAKAQRFGTCNTTETLLVHQQIAPFVLPRLAKAFADLSVELRGCVNSRAIVPSMLEASELDWETEYLAPILSIKVVASIADAMDHIDRYSSGHTESILTENYTRARKFLSAVDSSSVMVNASTRFADGFEYGLGAEIGISTDKFHARGPVGLEGLTSQKWIVLGDGHTRT